MRNDRERHQKHIFDSEVNKNVLENCLDLKTMGI